MGTYFDESPLTSGLLEPATNVINLRDAFSAPPTITSWRGLRDDHALVSDLVDVQGSYVLGGKNASLHLPIVFDVKIKPGKIKIKREYIKAQDTSSKNDSSRSVSNFAGLVFSAIGSLLLF